MQVKTDKSDSKRADAAEELRNYDSTAYPDIVPILVDVMLSDPKANVRSEAAHSLGKIRPISQNAGMALEQALAKDSSMRVRWQARSALLSYRIAGYHSPKKVEMPKEKPKDEPPLGVPKNPGIPPDAGTLKPTPGGPAPTRINVPQPLPAGPPMPPISVTVPSEPPKLRPPPSD